MTIPNAWDLNEDEEVPEQVKVQVEVQVKAQVQINILSAIEKGEQNTRQLFWQNTYQLFSVFRRSCPINSSELFVKVAQVVKTAVEANFQNAQVGVHQKFAGKIDFYAVQVFKNGYPHLRPEKSAK